jgi:hypothetical protein
MRNKKLENSVRALGNLYTVVIAAALTAAVVIALDVGKGLQSLELHTSFLFVAFVATLLPFFHGALRHLDDAYVENDNPQIKTGALIIDFALLFLHALAFLVLSQLLKKPADFAWTLILLLAIDVVWGAFANFGSSSSGPLSAESRWAIINFVFVSVVGVGLYAYDIPVGWSGVPNKLAALVMVACVLRSLADYFWCKEVYFPK